VTIHRQTLRLRLSKRRMPKRRDRANVRQRRHRTHRRRLVRNDDRRRTLDGYDLAALHALGRALLRRGREHGEEQQRK
jgi:hypothetical protein